MVKSKDDGSVSVAPFLKKCYDMVDDESTDSIISWSPNGENSFVISDSTEFSVRLLPEYFKHSNFSSFVRQLNIYGFRKTDADHWEFANDGFVRGQKHLLKTITRRKNVQGVDQRKQSDKPEHGSELPEIDESTGMLKEVENLKTDKNKLMQEMIKLRQHQETTDIKLLRLKDRIQGMEENQQQMLSFLVLVMQNPRLLVQFLRPKENNWRMAEAGTIVEEVNEEGESLPSDRSLVMYQPPLDGTPMPFVSTGDSEDPKDNFSSDELKDLMENADFMKLIMNENSHVPFIMPDLYDDGAWEKLLLVSPSKKRSRDLKLDEERDDGDGVMEMEPLDTGTESDKNRAFELLLQEMEKSDDDFEVEHLDSEKSRYLEILTEQMGFLASSENSH